MSQSKHQISVTGVDNTAKTFQSIQARAISTGNKIASAMGGALAAAGAYLSFSSIKGTIDELSHLSDIAAKANTTSAELRQLSTALSIIGIQGAEIDSLGKAFALMEKNTGRVGMAGFYETIGEIGKIEAASERAKAAMAAFGKGGLEFMPLINAAKESTAALEGAVNAIDKLRGTAADDADDVADAMTLATNTFKNLWYEAIGGVIKFLSGDMTSSVRQAMAEVLAIVRFAVEGIGLSFRNLFLGISAIPKAIGSGAGAAISTLYEKFLGGGNASWGDVFKNWWGAASTEIKGTGNDILETWTKDIPDMWKRMQENLAKASELENNIRNATAGSAGGISEESDKSSTNKPKEAEDKIKTPKEERTKEVAEAVAKAVQISNDLIMGGSNQARKLSMFGPTYENEQKKQTKLLQDIKENTKKTADEVGDGTTTYEVTNFGA